jgi:hypothetical protein
MHELDCNVRCLECDALDNVIRAQNRHHNVQHAYRALNC